MNNLRTDRVREDDPALPGRRQVLGVGILLAAVSLLPRNIALALGQNTPETPKAVDNSALTVRTDSGIVTVRPEGVGTL